MNHNNEPSKAIRPRRQRLKIYWESIGYATQKDFCKRLGIGEPIVSQCDKYEKNSELELKLLKFCPDLNLDWWKTGEGRMTVDEYPHGLDKFRQTAAQAETISKEKELPYGVTTVVEGKRISPKEERLLEILRTSPEAASIVEMMGAMDSDTRKDVQLGVQKEKLLRDLLKEKPEREVA